MFLNSHHEISILWTNPRPTYSSHVLQKNITKETLHFLTNYYISHTYPRLKAKSPQNSIIKPALSQGHPIFPEGYHQNQIPKHD